MGSLNELKEGVTEKSAIHTAILDIEAYIQQGILTRYEKTKSVFYLSCKPGKIPESINSRISDLEIKDNKVVVTLDLSESK